MSPRHASVALALLAALLLPGQAALADDDPATAAVGPGLALLPVPEGGVSVLRSALLPLPDGGQRLVMIVGNGLGEAVDPLPMFAVVGATGDLLAVGEPMGYSIMSGEVIGVMAPDSLAAGGVGIVLATLRRAPDEGLRVLTGVVAGDHHTEEVAALEGATVADGVLTGRARNISATDDLGSVIVVVACLGADGSPTAVASTHVELPDETPLARGETLDFSVDLGGAACADFIVSAVGGHAW